MMKKISGSCHCKAVKYTAEIDASRVTLCHCKDCQTMSGGSYRGSVIVDGKSLNINGTVKNYIKQADSGNSRIQAFCPECGTHLYATTVDGQPEEKTYNIRLGTVAERNSLPPTIEIWRDSAQSWLPELPNTKKIPQQP